MVDLSLSEFNRELVEKIVDRASTMFPGSFDRLSLSMDLTAVKNTDGLNLEALLQADDFNFSHDIWGIVTNLDRSTGALNNCFVPRFSR